MCNRLTEDSKASSTSMTEKSSCLHATKALERIGGEKKAGASDSGIEEGK